jgi:hypothetical protein
VFSKLWTPELCATTLCTPGAVFFQDGKGIAKGGQRIGVAVGGLASGKLKLRVCDKVGNRIERPAGNAVLLQPCHDALTGGCAQRSSNFGAEGRPVGHTLRHARKRRVICQRGPPKNIGA